jgi:hypothetical protein
MHALCRPMCGGFQAKIRTFAGGILPAYRKMIIWLDNRSGVGIVGAMQKGKTMKVGPVTGEGRWETFGQERGARSGDRRTTRLCAPIDIAEKRLAQKHVFLRNEPELPSRKHERILQDGNGLRCANGFFNSGSFGGEMQWRESRQTLANSNGRDAHEDTTAGWLGGRPHLRTVWEFSNSVVGSVFSVGVIKEASKTQK